MSAAVIEGTLGAGAANRWSALERAGKLRIQLAHLDMAAELVDLLARTRAEAVPGGIQAAGAIDSSSARVCRLGPRIVSSAILRAARRAPPS